MTQSGVLNSTNKSPSTSSADESPYRRITETAQRAASLSQFYRDSLRTIAQSFSSPYAQIYVRLPSEIIEHHWHCGPSDPGFWKQTVHSYLTESLIEGRARAKLLSGKDAAARIGVVSVPLHDERGAGIGAIALVSRVTREDARGHVAVLESLAGLTSYVSGLVRRADSVAGAAAPTVPSQALAKGAAVESVEEFAFAITNSLRNKLSCDHVALGMVRGHAVQLLSISGFDDLKPRSPGVMEIRAAMEECLDAEHAVTINSDSDANVTEESFMLHRQWHEAARGASVASIPLRVDDAVVAILSLRRSGNDPFTETVVAQIAGAVAPYASALMLVRKAHRSAARHVCEMGVGRVRRLLGRGHWGQKALVSGLLLFGAWFCFGRVAYSVAATARLVPAESRYITMPFEGVIESSEAVAGDPVNENGVLCTLDVRDLHVRQSELQAELEVAEREFNAALAEERRVDAQLASARRALVTAQLSGINQRLAQGIIRSPYAGVVVTGDLNKRIGSVFQQGEVLFQVAPEGSLELEIDIPEHDSENVFAGMTGHFVAEARPEYRHDLKVVRVNPSAQERDGRNVFVSVSALDATARWLRPGMEGVVRLDAGHRPVWWVTMHRAIDYLRLNFWL